MTLLLEFLALTPVRLSVYRDAQHFLQQITAPIREVDVLLQNQRNNMRFTAIASVNHFSNRSSFNNDLYFL